MRMRLIDLLKFVSDEQFILLRDNEGDMVLECKSDSEILKRYYLKNVIEIIPIGKNILEIIYQIA